MAARLTLEDKPPGWFHWMNATMPPHGPASSPLPDGRPLVVFLTGCTSGLGRVLADEFRAMGHTVIGCARRADRIERMRADFGTPHAFHVCDVTDENAVAALALEVGRGHVDVVIANAGIGTSSALPWKADSAEWRRVVDTNLNGVFYVDKHFGNLLVEQAKTADAPLKRLVNLASGFSHTTSHINAGYCASKWGVEALSKAFAQGLRAEGLANRVICVPLAPGVVKSEFNQYGADAGAWARDAAPFILDLSEKDNGASMSMARLGYYPPRYLASWAIPDGMPLPDSVVHPFMEELEAEADAKEPAVPSDE